MYIDYKYTRNTETGNAIDVFARFYEGEYVDEPDPEQPGETRRHYQRTYLKDVGRQFPVGTSQDDINAWFNAELLASAGERTPLW